MFFTGSTKIIQWSLVTFDYAYLWQRAYIVAHATSFVVEGGCKKYICYLRFLFTLFTEETLSGILLPPRSLPILLISCRSLYRLLAVPSGALIVENRGVSSANNLGLHWRSSNESPMYVGNKSRPNIEAWGTSALILAQYELWSLRIILCFVFLKKSVKRLNKFPEILLRLSLWTIPSWYTSSKALEISRNTPLTL